MKSVKLISLFLFLSLLLNAQDIIYTVSGEYNQNKTPLDSILVENLTNGTRILFGNLPIHDYYQINLTKGAYWGTVGIGDISNDISAFTVVSNTPGQLSIAYLKNSPTKIKISVFNVNGQLVYASANQSLFGMNSVDITLSHSGFYFVRVDAPFISQTFKAIGSDAVSFNEIKISAKNVKPTILKSETNILDSDFSYTSGDSIRVSVYKNEYYARPIGIKSLNSESLNFVFDVSQVTISGTSDAFVELDSITTYITDYDTTGLVQLNYTDDKPDLKPGDIIVVDRDTMGYLRRVIETTENDGSITAETEQAYLNDVFVNKKFKLHTGLIEPVEVLKSTSSLAEISKALTDENGYIHPVKIIYPDKNGKLVTKSAFNLQDEGKGDTTSIINFRDTINRDIYGEEGDNIHFYISDWDVHLKSDAIFEFDFDYEGELTEDTKVRKGKINRFKFYLDSEAGFLSKFVLDMNYSFDKSPNNPKLLWDVPMDPVAKFIVPPGIPVWIKFNVDLFGNYILSANAELHANWGFENKYSLKIGGEYTKETKELTPIYEYTPYDTIYPFNAKGEVNAYARFEVYPRAEALFYSFFGPWAEIVPYAKANYNAAFQSQITTNGSENFLAWDSKVDLGLDFRVGAEISFLGIFEKNILSPEPIPLYKDTFWYAPMHLSLISDLPQNANPGTTIPIKFKISNMQGNPVSLCPIYLEGNGSFSKQIIFTNTSGEASTNWTIPNSSGSNTFSATIYRADKTIIESNNYSLQVSSSIPSITTLAATNVGETSATLNGNVTSDGGSSVTERGFYWSSTDQTPDYGDNKTVVVGTTGNFNKTITGLNSGTKYYYRAFATNNKGTSVGSVKEFTTNEVSNSGTFVDGRDGKTYKWIKIGQHIWMAENLAYLPKVSPPSGESYSQPYYYVYGYNSSSVDEAKTTNNYATYGVLYNWSAAVSACPTGWHLPTDEEWKQLEIAIGMTKEQANLTSWRGTDQGIQMKAQSGWYNNGNGTNTSGFSALPGGYRAYGGIFNQLGTHSMWWSATEYPENSNYTWFRGNYYNHNGVFRDLYGKGIGLSVRCVKD